MDTNNDVKLKNPEIKKQILQYRYLLGFSPTVNLVDDIIQQFWFHDFYNSFISDDVFLKHLLAYLDKKKPIKFNRFDFYSFLFDQVIKYGKTRLVLQKIALVFEKRQSDALDPSEYVKLLRDANISKGKFDVLWMKKNHLGKIGKRDEEKLFIWEHHTLTEFLVAEHLLKQKNFLSEFQKLAILDQEGIIAFIPSWSGVLRFLLESPRGREVIEWIISFLKIHKENIDENLSELLTFVDIGITDEIRKKIFDLIYDSYFERLVWLPVWTRNRLSNFIDKKSYLRIKKDLKEWLNETETFIRRANIVSIVEGLLEKENKLITAEEEKFWRKTLINFANNPNDSGNGVLQRHSLAALTYFKDEKIIPIVAQKCFEETQDSIVRDEFIKFCSNSAPNSKHTIDYLVKGIKKDSSIYARLGLYKITKRESIKYLLEKISNDDNFLKSFLHDESIFDKEDGDHQFLENIQKTLNKKILTLLKKTIFRIFRIPDYYQEGESNFIKQTVLLIKQEDKNFIFKVLVEIKKSEDDMKALHLFFNYEKILALLLTPDNVTLYFNKINNFSQKVRERADSVVYIAKQINSEVGKAVYDKAVKFKLVGPVDEKAKNVFFKQQQIREKQKIYEDFLNFLEPSPGKYMTRIFKYFLQHRREIEEQWNDKNKKRLIKLAIDDNIDKIDPKNFKVSILDKNTRQFTWPTTASYYGDLLSVIKILAPEEIKKHRQEIINFIPYAFSDNMNLIMDLIEKIEDKDLAFVNKVMSDKNDDRRYLIPGTYIYLVGHYVKKGCKLHNSKPILKSFIEDKNIPEYEQEAALELLPLFINDSDLEIKEFLNNIFNNEEINEQKTRLAKTANEVLIIVFKDDKAIDWRFDQLKIPLKFDHRKLEVGIAHFVEPEEEELNTLSFAKPLIQLQEAKYLPKFLDILQYSIEYAKKNSKEMLWFTNYLWRIVISFADNLKSNGSFEPLKILESFINLNKNEKNINWLRTRITALRISYVNNIGKVNFLSFQPSVMLQQNIYSFGKEVEEQLTEGEKIKYKSQILGIKKKEPFNIFMKHPMKIFISHSTSTDEPKGIKQFTENVVKILKSSFSEDKVFFDQDKVLPSINRVLNKRLHDSRYCVAIYSERYITQFFKPESYIEKEFNWFDGLSRIYEKDFIVPVLFGIDKEYFQTSGIPFLSGKNYIEVSNKRDYEEEPARVSNEIISRINNFEKEYKKK